jgi:hypothetical protein
VFVFPKARPPRATHSSFSTSTSNLSSITGSLENTNSEVVVEAVKEECRGAGTNEVVVEAVKE